MSQSLRERFPCLRCEGKGYRNYETWVKFYKNGTCLRCDGSGIERTAVMCGTLKFENKAKMRGELVHVHNPKTGKKGKAIWDGFAKLENKEWWAAKGLGVPVFVPADAFVEGEVTLRVPAPILAMGIKKEVMVNGRLVARANQVKVLTRNPLNSFEKKIHNRWPVVMVDGKIFQWTDKDVLSGPAQSELPLGG